MNRVYYRVIGVEDRVNMKSIITGYELIEYNETNIKI
jgi:hypothetical protein